MDNKKNIMNIALKSFSLKGFDAVGVQEIVEKSGVTKPTLYHYFGSKTGLLEAIFDYYYGMFYENLILASEYKGDITLTLQKLILCYFNFAKQNNDFYRMQLSMYFVPEENEVSKLLKPYNEKNYKLIEEVFIKAAFDHGNMKGRHTLYSVTFIGMINTYIGLFLNGYINDLDDNLMYQTVHQFMHGIFS